MQGTNGGVTLAGLAASTAGGLFMGLVFYLSVLAAPAVARSPGAREVALRQWVLVPAGVCPVGHFHSPSSCGTAAASWWGEL